MRHLHSDRIRHLFFTLAAAAVLVIAQPRAATRAPAALDPSLVDRFARTRDLVLQRATAAFGKGSANSLAVKIANAEAAFRRGQGCAAVGLLGAYLNEAQALRRAPGIAAAEDLFNLGASLRRALVAALSESPCGVPDADRAPAVSLSASDNTQVRGTVQFGEPRLWTVHAEGETWTQLAVPGLQSDSGRPGAPAVPMVRRLIAVPHGARPSIAARPAIGGTFRLNLYPEQLLPAMARRPPLLDPDTDPPDSFFADPPFTKDARAYETNAAVPSDICRIALIGESRDVQIAQMDCAAAQYNPVTDTFVRFRALDFDVRFEGGNGAFITSRSRGPFDSNTAMATASVLNKDAVDQYVSVSPGVFGCIGEELLILTHADLHAEANQLADFKRGLGIPTSVFDVNDGAGPAPDTAEEIRAFIATRYQTCHLRASYVLLFGDSEFVPPFSIAGRQQDEDIATDYPYAIYPAFVPIGYPPYLVENVTPTFAVGRLPVDAADAHVAVEKITGYQGNPPFAPSFYKNATIASQFECCRIDVEAEGTDGRAFIQVVEEVRNRLMDNGYTVQRIYAETVSAGNPNADPPVPPYTGDPLPRFYADGSDLPADIGPSSGFIWHDSTSLTPDVSAAFAAGRFLVVHLDHGGASTWVNPKFSSTHVSALTNGALLPFVLGFNCSSGYFDNETSGGNVNQTYFSERLIRNPNGGAIGVVAASRTTFATGNIMIKGSIDAALPGVDASFGDDGPHPRLGDMLNSGKLYMLNAYGVSDGRVIDHLNLYNLLGDPTLEMWTALPYDLPTIVELIPIKELIHVVYPLDGTTITALQRTERGVLPIGRGVVTDGMARLEFFEAPVEGVPLQFFASRPNGVSTPLVSR